MTKQLFLIEYESSQWCGGKSYVVVWATDDFMAEDAAQDHMDEEMRALFADEYDDEGQDADDSAPSTVNSVEPFGPEHEAWVWYQDPEQRAAFYPTIGEPQ